MKRRDFITALGGAAVLPLAARAQRHMPRIGMLWHAGSAEEEGPYFIALMKGFAELGYVEGKTAHFEHRYADEHYERFLAMAEELIALKCDVIMASILPAALAAARLTSNIPIVFVIVSDPVRTGLADSLARPGRNLTGMSNVTDDLTAKRVHMLKEVVPTLKRLGVMFNPTGGPQTFAQFRDAAAGLEIETIPFEVRGPPEIEPALVAAAAAKLNGIAIASDGNLFNARKRLGDWGIEQRVAMTAANLDSVQAGALMAYGPNHTDIFRRSTAVVDKILKGEKPGDIPVQQPITFNLRINLKTAKAIGIGVPPIVLALADEVVE